MAALTVTKLNDQATMTASAPSSASRRARAASRVAGNEPIETATAPSALVGGAM